MNSFPFSIPFTVISNVTLTVGFDDSVFLNSLHSKKKSELRFKTTAGTVSDIVLQMFYPPE